MTAKPGEWFRTANPAIFHVASQTRESGIYYAVDRVYGACGCPGYRGYGHCKHNDAAQAFPLEDMSVLPMSPFVREPALAGR